MIRFVPNPLRIKCLTKKQTIILLRKNPTNGGRAGKGKEVKMETLAVKKQIKKKQVIESMVWRKNITGEKKQTNLSIGYQYSM